MFGINVLIDVIIIAMIVIIFSDVIICKIQRRHRRKDFLDLRLEIEQLNYKIEKHNIQVEERFISQTKEIEDIKKSLKIVETLKSVIKS